MTDIDDPQAETPAGPDGEPPRLRSRWSSRTPAQEAEPARPPSTPAGGGTLGRSNLTEVRVITQQAVIDEAGVRPLRAVVLHPRLSAWVFGIIFAAGLLYGVTAPTQYEAEVDLFVGRLDASVEAIPSLVAANEELAQNYSRLLSTPELVSAVAAQTGLTESDVRDQVEATQLASSPFIRVTGSGASPEEADELTDVAAELLMNLANDFAAVDEDPAEVLAEHATEVEALNAARAAVAREQQTIELAESTAVREAAIARLYEAQAEIDVLTFRVSVLESRYRDLERATASEGLVRRASEVEGIGSNRLGNISLGIAVGLLGGIVMAVSLVTLLELLKAVKAEPQTADAEA